jgi:hypothetical protein
MPPSRVGTIDPLDTKTRAYVDADLKEVATGSSEAAFVFKRSDLDRLRARREELGITGDESERVQRESRKRALADAKRRADAAAAEVAVLEDRIAADAKAEKAAVKADDKADGAKVA